MGFDFEPVCVCLDKTSMPDKKETLNALQRAARDKNTLPEAEMHKAGLVLVEVRATAREVGCTEDEIRAVEMQSK